MSSASHRVESTTNQPAKTNSSSVSFSLSAKLSRWCAAQTCVRSPKRKITLYRSYGCRSSLAVSPLILRPFRVWLKFVNRGSVGFLASDGKSHVLPALTVFGIRPCVHNSATRCGDMPQSCAACFAVKSSIKRTSPV